MFISTNVSPLHLPMFKPFTLKLTRRSIVYVCMPMRAESTGRALQLLVCMCAMWGLAVTKLGVMRCIRADAAAIQRLNAIMTHTELIRERTHPGILYV